VLESLLEGLDRLVVVERVDEAEPLVEVLLGLLRSGGDLLVQGAEVVVERRRAGGRASGGLRRLISARG